MEFLSQAVSMYQQSSQSSGNYEEEDHETVKESVKRVQEQGVEPPKEEDIHDARNAHEKVYKQGNTDEASDEELGKAAGVEAYHAYEKKQEEGEDEGQPQLIQMAIQEGMKLFSSGGGQDKGAVIQGAIAMATKLFMSQGGLSMLLKQFGGGNGGEGGMGSMAGLMSKFM
ncbi:hypothetical protein BGZ46_009261 [Entomortierella lignicola]|nr:hypothetical protein BGZ46_009261 [Entomortierella lignicola]